MKKIRALSLMLFVTLLYISPFAKGDEPIKAYLDLAPFSFVTDHTPATRDDILSSKWEVWTITSQTDKERLRKILNTGEKYEFDKDYLRIVVIDNKDEYHITYGGVVKKNDVTSLRLDRDELIKFQQSLDKSQREVKPLEFQ
jgi:ribulose bisphosphate carboxylase small subunit